MKSVNRQNQKHFEFPICGNVHTVHMKKCTIITDAKYPSMTKKSVHIVSKCCKILDILRNNCSKELINLYEKLDKWRWILKIFEKKSRQIYLKNLKNNLTFSFPFWIFLSISADTFRKFSKVSPSFMGRKHRKLLKSSQTSIKYSDSANFYQFQFAADPESNKGKEAKSKLYFY